MKIEFNNIYLGDCGKLIHNLEDKTVDLIVTDPPYDIGAAHSSGIMKDASTIAYLKEIEAGEFNRGFDMEILKEFIRVLKKINIYIFCSKSQIIPLLDFFVKENNSNFEIIVWKKDNVPPLCGTHYLVDKEYCLYFWETGAPVHIPFERGETVLFSKVNKADKEKYHHPTIKNQSHIETMILNSSESGGVVLDPFLGSGTTAAAAKALGRKYIGFEINPKYYETAKNRLKGIDANGEMDLFETDFDQIQLEFEEDKK